MFIQQKTRSQQLLNSLQQNPLVPNYLLTALQAEFTNLESIYTSYKPLILTVTQLLKREPSFNGMSPLSKCAKRNLLPFLGDALSWLTGTAMTRDERHQEKSQPADQNTDPTTGNIGTCHLDTKCHQICQASQQTTYHCSYGRS